MITDLSVFLQARLDEDEQAARGLQGATVLIGKRPDFYGAGGPAAEDFWARFDPARVLADVEAKRKIVELHNYTTSYLPDEDRTGEHCRRCGDIWPCEELLALVAPYRSHPDFDPAWAEQ